MTAMILTTQCYHLMGVCVQTKDKLECVDQYLTAIDQSFGVKYRKTLTEVGFFLGFLSGFGVVLVLS